MNQFLRWGSQQLLPLAGMAILLLPACHRSRPGKVYPDPFIVGELSAGDATAEGPVTPTLPGLPRPVDPKTAIIPKVNVGNLRETNKEVVIDASTSDATTFEWEQLAGPGTLKFSSPNFEDTSVSADKDGFYWVRLTVTSSDGSTAYDDFELLWDTTAPDVKLSPEIRSFQPITVNAAVGSDAKVIRWTQLSGPGQMIFSAADSATSILSADTDGTYIVRLSVEDKIGNATFAEMSFVWETGVPAVSLGQDIMTNKEIALDAATAEAQSFSWTQVSGPGSLVFSAANAEDSTISATVDGTYVVRLTITTAGGQSAYDEINFVWDTTAPTLNVGQDLSKKYRATIDAITSGANSYLWTQKSGPGKVIFSSSKSEDTALIADQAGSYEIELTVSDQAGNVAKDTAVINFDYDVRVYAQAVSSGGSHSCAILDDASVACWGYNYQQELGYGDENKFGEGTDRYAPPSFPINLGNNKTAVALSANYSHSCAILNDGSVKCWGQNASGQLGYGDASRRTVPPLNPIALNQKAVSIATGFAHTCVILDDGNVKCWGLNSSGQLGVGDYRSRNAPEANPIDLGLGRTAKSLSLGAYHSCALLDNDSVKCWGTNTNGELGLGDKNYRNKPAALAVALLGPAANITSGAFHSCAALQDGKLQCWGKGKNGQLGYGDLIDRLSPDGTAVNFGAGKDVVSVSAGLSHTCALLDDKSVQCWGTNDEGQLGYGDLVNRNAPTQTAVALGQNVKALSAGRLHTCTVLEDDTLKCWGSNSYGQLGNGKIVDGRLPPPTVIGYDD